MFFDDDDLVAAADSVRIPADGDTNRVGVLEEIVAYRHVAASLAASVARSLL